MSPLSHLGPGSSKDDRGVSAVIGVILMVAITVAIAATVYIWAGGFGESGDGPESASATAKAVSLDSDSKGEWIKVTLTDGDGPYDNSSVGVSVATQGGSWSHLCDSPDTATAGGTGCTDDFTNWEVGGAKWFPCTSTDRHQLSVAVLETAITDRSVDCQQTA